MRASIVQSAEASSSAVARPSSARRSRSSAPATPIRSASVWSGATCTVCLRSRPTRAVRRYRSRLRRQACPRTIPKQRRLADAVAADQAGAAAVETQIQMSEKRARPSGVVAVRPESVMEGMEIESPDGKASGALRSGGNPLQALPVQLSGQSNRRRASPDQGRGRSSAPAPFCFCRPTSWWRPSGNRDSFR
jgi:hypothetical protein